jgi:translation initiation factor RLI1
MQPKLSNGEYFTTFLSLFQIFRHVLHAKKTAFIVEHDFMMSTYLADRVIVFDGQPGLQTKANA